MAILETEEVRRHKERPKTLRPSSYSAQFEDVIRLELLEPAKSFEPSPTQPSRDVASGPRLVVIVVGAAGATLVASEAPAAIKARDEEAEAVARIEAAEAAQAAQEQELRDRMDYVYAQDLEAFDFLPDE